MKAKSRTALANNYNIGFNVAMFISSMFGKKPVPKFEELYPEPLTPEQQAEKIKAQLIQLSIITSAEKGKN